MGAFLVWTVGRHDSLQQRLRLRAQELRHQYDAGAGHGRLPSGLGELQASFELVLEFAVHAGAVSEPESEVLRERCVAAFLELMANQAKYHHAADPARQFLSLLQTALRLGHAHVSDRAGRVPDQPSAWGWRRTSPARWFPQNARIGWLNGADLYLDPAASYEVAQQMAGTGSERLPVTEQTLRHRLREPAPVGQHRRRPSHAAGAPHPGESP